MKIIWEDGYEIEKPFGITLVGISHNWKRPATISWDLEEVPKHWDDARLNRYTEHLYNQTAH